MVRLAAFALNLTLVAALLAGCALDLGSITDGEVAQTAVAQGCWSADRRPTPYPVTVTPLGGSPTHTPTVIANYGDPTFTPAPAATRLPTTTALPRCTPQPGRTQVPWPTPEPTEPPYPTNPPNAAQPQVGEFEVMRLPNAVLGMDVAVHPQGSWPAVAAIDIPVTNQGEARVFVRVYNPTVSRWSSAQTVDRDGSHPGDRFRNVALGITPDSTVHAVWGTTGFPRLELFYARSTDYGETWSSPERIGESYISVLDMAASSTNELYVVAIRRDGEQVAPELLHRSFDGVWSSEALPISNIWYASSAAITIVGDGTDARLVAMLTASTERPGSAAIFSRPLSGGQWVTTRSTTTEASGLLTDAQVVAYPYQLGEEQRQGITFSATLRDTGGSMYAITSLDGGATWGAFAPVVTGQGRVTSGGIAYDPLAQRLVAMWNCCEDAIWGNAESTHYAAWADPATSVWSPAPSAGTDARSPLVSGAQSAALTQVVHAVNARIAWMVWLEDGQMVRARSYSLNRIIPRNQYPEPTARPTATTTGGT